MVMKRSNHVLNTTPRHAYSTAIYHIIVSHILEGLEEQNPAHSRSISDIALPFDQTAIVSIALDTRWPNTPSGDLRSLA
jgi:hypothetical protein